MKQGAQGLFRALEVAGHPPKTVFKGNLTPLGVKLPLNIVVQALNPIIVDNFSFIL
jgi:hypothetical protein